MTEKMTPRIETIGNIKLVGMFKKMTPARDTTKELFRGLMPRKKEINALNPKIYCLQLYDVIGFDDFNENTQFVKWGAVEVADFSLIPEGMSSLVLEAGKYAVFIHHGRASAFHKTWTLIFDSWLPSSGYSLDSRPHFQLLPPNYNPVDPNAEEEVWVPIK
ncbi:MAG TPA: GyrI-like domain-containing protein [Fulvivirga sp.]|nr:GyrI-like domain-containing protein [Fulvivirga sp.]